MILQTYETINGQRLPVIKEVGDENTEELMPENREPTDRERIEALEEALLELIMGEEI